MENEGEITKNIIEEFKQLNDKDATNNVNTNKDEDTWHYLRRVSLIKKFNAMNENNQNIFEHTSSTSNNNDLTMINGNKSELNLVLLKHEEIILKFQSLYLYKKSQLIEGELYVTNYRVQFLPKNQIFLQKEFISPEFFLIPITFIINVTKKSNSALNKYNIKLTIDDRQDIIFGFLKKSDRDTFLETILNFTSNYKLNTFFAFSYNQKYEEITTIENGWSIYNHISEYQRMGIDEDNLECDYRLCMQTLNITRICNTYPNFFFVPKCFKDEEIVEISQYRSKQRLPVLSWASQFNSAAIWRSSQTKAGLSDKRSHWDERYLEELSKKTNRLSIFDARPYLNALANKMKGMGFENKLNYKNAEIFFCDIENIHSVKTSYDKMKILCEKPLEGNHMFDLELYNTGWYPLVSKILKASVNIAASILENTTVLVHCSDGWDRTSQLTSLSEIILDPYYRTLSGFEVLIEKEWISFGHQFATRNGHEHNKNKHDAGISPIFIQWLDCVYQLIIQFPNSFEFNSNLLVFLAYHVKSCLYGTFLMNSQKDFNENFIKFKTVSIWTEININKEKFINRSFQPKGSRNILTPSCAMYSIKIWKEYFLKWNPHYIMHHNSNENSNNESLNLFSSLFL